MEDDLTFPAQSRPSPVVCLLRRSESIRTFAANTKLSLPSGVGGADLTLLDDEHLLDVQKSTILRSRLGLPKLTGLAGCRLAVYKMIATLLAEAWTIPRSAVGRFQSETSANGAVRMCPWSRAMPSENG